jgi:hypothetical protein
MAVLTVNAAVLAGRSLAAYCLSSATGGASRRIAVSCPCEASRAIADVLADMRSIAASGIFLLRARTTYSDCLASLRPSERSDSAPPLFADRGSEVERVQSWRVSHRAQAEPCRYLVRGTSTSVGSVTPGCLLFPSEERSDEVSLPDTAPKTIRQPERLECANDVQTHETVKRARGVAKGPPSVTSENQRWRPGARP